MVSFIIYETCNAISVKLSDIFNIILLVQSFKQFCAILLSFDSLIRGFNKIRRPKIISGSEVRIWGKSPAVNFDIRLLGSTQG